MDTSNITDSRSEIARNHVLGIIITGEVTLPLPGSAQSTYVRSGRSPDPNMVTLTQSPNVNPHGSRRTM